MHSLHSYALRPEIFARGGAVAVAALAVVPLAFFASKRRWAAFVLGGSLVILVLELVPWLFPRFADAISLSQARRAAGFVPFAFAVAGGAAVATCFLRFLVLPVALGAGIALQLAYPGGWGALALAAGLAFHPYREARGPLVAAAVFLFALPVAVHGFRTWSAAYSSDPSAPTPGLLGALRNEVPKRAVVFSDLETSYRISAYAPVYVASAPPAHVADTKANYPYGRRKATIRYFQTGDITIPEQLLATWLVVDKSRFHVHVPWKLVYSDDRYALYHRAA